MNGLVGAMHVLRVRVGIGIDRNGLDAERSGGPLDAAGNLAAVCNQYLAEHGHILNTPKRVSAMGSLRQDSRLSDNTSRVLRGSITPSSHNRAEA